MALVFAFGLGLGLGPATASAQRWNAGASARATVGYTDNVRSAAGGDTAGALFYRLRPGVQAFLLAPRGTVLIGYNLDLLLFQGNSSNNALNHTLTAAALLETSERGRLELEADGTFGRTNNVFLLGAPEAGGVDFVPAGDNSFRNLGVQQRFRYRASASTSLFQTSGLRTFDTSIDGLRVSSVLSAEAGAGVSLASETSTYELVGGARYLEFEADEDFAADQEFLDVSGRARWRRALSPSFVAAAEAGAALAIGPAGDLESRLRVVGGAEVAYYARWGGAAVAYRRDSAPNLFLGITSLTDSVTGRAFLPLVGRDRDPATLTLASSVGRQWGSGLDFDTGTTRAEWTTTLADAALLWSVRPWLQASARYQFIDQDGDGMVLQDYRRNTVTVELLARYGGPPDEQPSVADIAERDVDEELDDGYDDQYDDGDAL